MAVHPKGGRSGRPPQTGVGQGHAVFFIWTSNQVIKADQF
jgi:hypothetical protein